MRSPEVKIPGQPETVDEFHLESAQRLLGLQHVEQDSTEIARAAIMYGLTVFAKVSDLTHPDRFSPQELSDTYVEGLTTAARKQGSDAEFTAPFRTYEEWEAYRTQQLDPSIQVPTRGVTPPHTYLDLLDGIDHMRYHIVLPEENKESAEVMAEVAETIPLPRLGEEA